MRDFNLAKNLPRLLASREEAKIFSSFLPKEKVLVNMDFARRIEKCFERKFIELSDFAFRHMHRFCLIILVPEFSGLRFHFTTETVEKDGFASKPNINLNLRSDLVVLSACQNRTRKRRSWHEGLIGLTRGFMYAGAKRIVASLWKVDDAATAEFMKRFIRICVKTKPCHSFTTNSKRMKPNSLKSPYFWAGFTIQGDYDNRNKGTFRYN